MQVHTRKHPTSVVSYIEKSNSSDWRSSFSDIINKYSEAGAALKGFRIREGMTQKELSENTGIGQANISKMENGKRPIGKVLAKKFAVMFKTDYRVFL